MKPTNPAYSTTACGIIMCCVYELTELVLPLLPVLLPWPHENFEKFSLLKLGRFFNMSISLLCTLASNSRPSTLSLPLTSWGATASSHSMLLPPDMVNSTPVRRLVVLLIHERLFSDAPQHHLHCWLCVFRINKFMTSEVNNKAKFKNGVQKSSTCSLSLEKR